MDLHFRRKKLNLKVVMRSKVMTLWQVINDQVQKRLVTKSAQMTRSRGHTHTHTVHYTTLDVMTD